MAKEKPEQDAAAEKEPESSKTLWVVIIAGLVLLVMVAMGGGLLLIWTKAAALRGQPSQNRPAAPAKAISQPPLRPVYALDTFIVPLAPPQSQRFLRITLALELADDSGKMVLQRRLPRIRDAILEILPNRTVEEITTLEGKETLRKEILKGLAAVLPEKIVGNLFFTELVVE